MKLASRNIRFGFDVFDIINFVRLWCIPCFKMRYHESYNGYSVCLACCNIIEEATAEDNALAERFENNELH